MVDSDTTQLSLSIKARDLKTGSLGTKNLLCKVFVIDENQLMQNYGQTEAVLSSPNLD